MLRSRVLWGLVACTGWLLGGSPVAHTRAQSDPQPTQASPNVYDGFIEQALQSNEAGRFAEARTLFRRAHDLMPTARTLRTIGMCSFNLGDYVDAVANLESALTDPRKPLNDEQRRHVTDLIARSNQRVGRFRLLMTPSDAILTVDGRAPSLINQHELVLEIGRHELQLQSPGYRSYQSALMVDGGDRTSLELRLSQAPEEQLARSDAHSELPLTAAGSGALAPGRAARALDDSPRRSGTLQATLGWTSLAVGAAGLIAFGVVSALAIAKEQDLADHCPQSQCMPAQHKDVDTYDTLKTVSTITAIGGGAFIALGAGLLLFDSPPRPERARLQPILGPGAVGLRGQL